MAKEQNRYPVELEQIALGLAHVFIQRQDLYARQLADGAYVCIRQPLRPWHLLSHLRGTRTLGTYALNPDSRTRFLAFDADGEEDFLRLVRMAERMAGDGIPAYLEQSWRGGHLWLFFSNSVEGIAARVFGQALLAAFDIPGMELFPKQSELAGGPGSLIRLPFGIHRKTGRRYGFVLPNGDPLASTFREQMAILSHPQTVPEASFFDTVSRTPQIEKKPVFAPATAVEGPLSNRIKERMTVRAFVSQFVELSASGRGKCPFHPDDHASFSVNDKGNYWNCFAGCGGGSIIDFWMKWRDCDYKTAILGAGWHFTLKHKGSYPVSRS